MLDNLEITNGSMTPKFNKNIFNYEVYIDSDVTSLDLNYELSSDYPVTIYGNDYLTEGEGHVLIEVFDNEVITYTLTVYKEEVQEVFNDNTYSSVEVSNNSFIHEHITPITITSSFILIALLFCIIFRKK